MLTLGDGRLERDRVDKFCGLLADHIRDLIPKSGCSSITVHVELADPLKPARFAAAASISGLSVKVTPERRRR